MRCTIGLTLHLGGVVCKLTPTNEWIEEINVKLEQSSSGAGITGAMTTFGHLAS